MVEAITGFAPLDEHSHGIQGYLDGWGRKDVCHSKGEEWGPCGDKAVGMGSCTQGVDEVDTPGELKDEGEREGCYWMCRE